QTSGSIAANLRHLPWLPVEVSLEDKGVGGVDGGLGPLYWGLVLPLGLWQAGRGARRLWQARAGRSAGASPPPHAGSRVIAVLALQFAVALVPYLISPFAWYDVSSRYLLASAVPGAAIAAVLLDRLRPRWPALWAGGCAFAVLCSALSLPLLAGTKDLHQ